MSDTNTQPTPSNLALMDIKQIINCLPQRYPFLLIDRVLTMDDTRIKALKNVSINEPFFQGHFPAEPVMPGVLQIEAMAQAAGVLFLSNLNMENQLTFFMSADKVKFRKAVVPGDQLEITAEIVKVRGNKIGVAATQCHVAGQLVSSGELMFTFMDSAPKA